MREQLDSFLKNYYRDLMQSQPSCVQILLEKLTVQNVIEPVAAEYTIPVVVGRGYANLGSRYEMAERFHKSGKENLVLLVVSDFDPEGEDIAHSFARSLRDDFNIGQVRPVKVALTRHQAQELNLPPQMKAKAGSSRRGKFVDRHGEDVFELEAVPPDRLQTILRDTIEGVLEMDAFRAEQERERTEANHLVGVRRSLLDLIDGSSLMSEGETE
jgi:hypothetical protein